MAVEIPARDMHYELLPPETLDDHLGTVLRGGDGVQGGEPEGEGNKEELDREKLHR